KDDKEQSQSALRWLLDVMVSQTGTSGQALEYKVFRIENDELLAFLNLENRPGSFRYSLKEIQPKFSELEREGARIEELEEKQHTKFDQALMELNSHLQLFLRLAQGRTPYIIPVDAEAEDWKTYADTLRDSFRLAAERLRGDKKIQELNDED